MAICPMLREECIGEECAWWWLPEDWKDQHDENCSIVTITRKMYHIKSELESVNSSIADMENNSDDSLKDRLDDLKDGLKDIYSKLESISEATWGTYYK